MQGISDIIITPGLINRDFSDIKATMIGMGYAMMGTAIGRGENAAVEAARQAISCPLLEDTRIAGSRGILINITGSRPWVCTKSMKPAHIIREAAEYDDVQINFGVILERSLGDAVKITVIATGFQGETVPVGDLRSELAARISAPAIPIQMPPVAPPAPLPVMQAEPEPEPEPVLMAEADPVLDLDDLDTPAYLRQGRLLN